MSSLCSLSGYDKEIMTVDHNGCRIVAATKCCFFFISFPPNSIYFSSGSQKSLSHSFLISVYLYLNIF